MSCQGKKNINRYQFYIFYLVFYRYPLKAVKVMHTVALRTEATIVGGEKPENLGQAFKVRKLSIYTLIFVITPFFSLIKKKRMPHNSYF
jgi:hypothetical protein